MLLLSFFLKLQHRLKNSHQKMGFRQHSTCGHACMVDGIEKLGSCWAASATSWPPRRGGAFLGFISDVLRHPALQPPKSSTNCSSLSPSQQQCSDPPPPWVYFAHCSPKVSWHRARPHLGAHVPPRMPRVLSTLSTIPQRPRKSPLC